MGGIISRWKDKAEPKVTEEEAQENEEEESAHDHQDPGALMRQRAEEKRLREAQRQLELEDHVTPVRIRKTLSDFLDQDFDSPQAMHAAVDAYACEIELLEQEGQLVTKLLETSNKIGSIDAAGGSVNEVRSAIEMYLSGPSRKLDESLDETARLLVSVDVDLPDGDKAFSPVLPIPPPRVHGRGHLSTGDIPPFTGQIPRTSATDAAFLKNINSEIGLLDAERKVAEQVAELKHQRQQAQLRHYNIQRLMASQKGEGECDTVMTSAKVIMEQKDLLRKWQAEQDKLDELKKELQGFEAKLKEANEHLLPMLAQNRTLKMHLDKAVEDELEHEKANEEYTWLQAEERGAAAGVREPLTQDELFRLDFVAFKMQSWEDNREVREKRIESDKSDFKINDLEVNKQRQSVNMIKSEVNRVLEQVAELESVCQKYCERSDLLRAKFSRLPTTRHPTAIVENPEERNQEDHVEEGFGDGISPIPTKESEIVFWTGCDSTHDIELTTLDAGWSTEYYYIGTDIDEQGPNLENLKPDVTLISEVIDLEVPRTWPENFPLECVAARWSGFISISTGGMYTFSTESNDGSYLWVSGSMVVDNGGLHGMRKVDGTAPLSAGLHTFKAEFFVSSGSPGMIVRMSGPDTENENGLTEILLLTGYHRKGWESVGAFESVELGDPKRKDVEEVTVEPKNLKKVSRQVMQQASFVNLFKMKPGAKDTEREKDDNYLPTRPEEEQVEEIQRPTTHRPKSVRWQEAIIDSSKGVGSKSQVREATFFGEGDDMNSQNVVRQRSVSWVTEKFENRGDAYSDDDEADNTGNYSYQRLRLQTAGTQASESSRPGTQYRPNDT